MAYPDYITDFAGQYLPTPLPEYSESAGYRISVEQSPAGGSFPFLIENNDISSQIVSLDIVVPEQVVYPLKVSRFVNCNGIPYLPPSDPNFIDYSELSLIDWTKLPVSRVQDYMSAAVPAPVPSVTVHEYDLMILDGNGQIFIDTSGYELTVKTWGIDYCVAVWSLRVGTHLNQVTAVLRLSSNEFIVPGLCPWDIYPEYGELDGSCIRITSPFVSYRTSKIVLIPGTNSLIDYDSSLNSINFDFAIGAGAGKATIENVFPEQQRYMQSLQGVKGVNGNIEIRANSCFRLTPTVESASTGPSPEVVFKPGSLELTDNCQPCCQCHDYVNVYEAERRISTRYAGITDYIQQIYDDYVITLNRFKDVEEIYPIKFLIEPVSESVSSFSIGFCNSRDYCLKDVYIFIEFIYTDNQAVTWDSTISGGTIVTGSGYRANNLKVADFIEPQVWRAVDGIPSYVIAGTYPYFWVYFEGINRSELGAVQFSFNWNTVGETGRAIVTLDAYQAVKGQLSNSTTSPVPGKFYGLEPTPLALTNMIRLVDYPIHIPIAPPQENPT